MTSKPEVFLERRLIRQTEKALKEAGITSPTSLLVGVSGGPDSIALLHMLWRLRKPLSLNLTVAHINHGVRRLEGIEDLRFVRDQAAKFNIPVFTRTLDHPKGGQHTKSVSEQFLRTARYQFFEDLATELKIDHVVVGHTADDQAETILLHLIRGSGLSGLVGMQLKGSLPVTDSKVHLIRPLLAISKAMTLEYCNSVGMNPRVDSTNQSSVFLRNRIRNELVPLLSQYNPAINESLIRLSHSSYQATEFMEEHVRRIWHNLIEQSPANITISKKLFASEHPAIQATIIKKAYNLVAPPDSMLSQKQIDDIRQLLSVGAGRQLRLPGQIEFTTTYSSGVFDKSFAGNPEKNILGTHPINFPGVTTIPGWKIESSVVSLEDWTPKFNQLSQNAFVASLDMEAIGTEFYVRGRLQGDRFQPMGMIEDKRLQDFFVDEHIPQSKRDQVPLLFSSSGLVWVVGHRIANWVRITDTSTTVLITEFTRL
jgi:tRNA(Ile)-lysidine synthase